MDLEKSARRSSAERAGAAGVSKGYRGYPCVLCTSVNSEIVHGYRRPSGKLREGDIVSLDFGMEVERVLRRFGGDRAGGKISPELQKLLDVDPGIGWTARIDKMRPGNRLGRTWGTRCRVGSSSTAIRCAGVRGARHRTKMHDEPNLPNYGEPGRGARLQKAW